MNCRETIDSSLPGLLSTSTSRLSTSWWACCIKTITILQNMRISFTKLNIVQYVGPTSPKFQNYHPFGRAKFGVSKETDRSKVAVVKLPSPGSEAPPVAVALHVFNRGVELTNMDDTSIWEELMAVTWKMMYDIRINHVLWHKMNLYWR